MNQRVNYAQQSPELFKKFIRRSQCALILEFIILPNALNANRVVLRNRVLAEQIAQGVDGAVQKQPAQGRPVGHLAQSQCPHQVPPIVAQLRS